MRPTHQAPLLGGSEHPHIVIIGCGFGGIEAAKALRGKACRVTVIDRANHHLFQPLLYQVATAGLSAPAVAAPIRHIFRNQANLTVLQQAVTDIDPRAKRVTFADGTGVGFDALIVAAGASHSYFGHNEWAQHAPGLKTLADAMRIRQRMLQAFEHAERRAADPGAKAATPDPLTFVVIGAGPTGVEMAGTMAEIARHTLKGEFRHIDPTTTRVVLLEGGPRVLASFNAGLSAKALRQLQKLGVEVRLNTVVTDVTADSVMMGNTRLPSDCTVWAAGVQASPLGGAVAEAAGVPLDRAGRVPVAQDLRPGHLTHVFVVGDMAGAKSGSKKGGDKPVPGVSPAAKQMGRSAARNAWRVLQGQPTRPFVYIDYGNLATIGRNSAIAHVGPLQLWGLLAWLFWLFVHIFFLIGFKNRLVVMTEWAWSYFTLARSARVFWHPQ